MANIKVLVDATLASENTVNEILAEASKIAPPRATVVRDSNGKVVSVNVGLPINIAEADLKNAAEKINGNRGVATAMSFPISSGATDESFSSVTPGTAVPLYGPLPLSGSTDISVILNYMTTQASVCKFAQPQESYGGTGSAVQLIADGTRYTDQMWTDPQTYVMYPIHGCRSSFACASPLLSSIEGWSMSFKARFGVNTEGGVVYTQGTIKSDSTLVGLSIEGGLGQEAVRAELIIAGANAPDGQKNYLRIYVPNWPTQDMYSYDLPQNFDINSWNSYSMTVSPTGIVTFAINDTTHTVTMSQLPPAVPSVRFLLDSMCVLDAAWNTTATFKTPGAVFDDFKFQVLSGNL
jgi:hypothetical protein